MTKIGFIGCGNMGSALAKATCSVSQTKLYIFDKNAEKCEEMAKALGATSSDSITIAKECDFIFLAVKPNIVETVASEIKDALAPNAVLVSMAAGVSLKSLSDFFGDGKKIIRIMPNTPVALGLGVVLFSTLDSVSEDEIEAFKNIMSGVGTLDAIDEKLIDAASALSGCGPAFVYMFIEALADGAVQCGLPRDKAMLYACKTLEGAQKMVLETGKHPGQLKDEVCSPGGSTIEGVHALEDSAFRAAASEAVIAAFEKTKLLGKK